MSSDSATEGSQSSRGLNPDPAANSSIGDALRSPVSKRQFLRVVSTLLGGAGAGHLISQVPSAQATYTPGTPTDLVDTDLTVRASLAVREKLGIGTSSPLGQLEVAGEVHGLDGILFSSDGRARQCYYSPGPPVVPPPSTAAGSWGRARTTIWGALDAATWEQVRTVDGSWEQLLSLSWNQADARSWGAVSAGV